DRTTVQHHVVTDHAAAADRKRKTRIGMQRRVVLDLGALADLDPLIVAAQHSAPPHADLGLEAHTADHDRGFGDPVLSVRREFRPFAGKLEYRHGGAPESGYLPCCTAVGERRGGLPLSSSLHWITDRFADDLRGNIISTERRREIWGFHSTDQFGNL